MTIPLKPPHKYGVLVSGRGSNLLAIMDAAGEGIVPALPSLVLSDKQDAKALDCAREYGVETLYIDPKLHKGKRAYGAEIIRELRNREIDTICLAGFMRILGENVVDAFPGRIINIHPSLLPAFPGLDVQRKALEAGVEESGCTVHFVETGVDSGPIIIQAKVKIEKSDSVESLSQRILKEEHRIYPQALAALLEGRLRIENGKVIEGKNR
jgi:phosphoribosylglycinamide formyltransferase-1